MKEDQRTKLSKHLIRNALMELLKEKRIYKITVKEICENAGLNRNTFYKYYGSPYDVLNDVQNILVNEIISTDNTDLFEHERVFRDMLLIIFKNSEWFRIILDCPDSDFVQKLMETESCHKNIPFIADVNDDNALLEYSNTYLSYGFWNSIKIWLNKKEPESIDKLTEYYGAINSRIIGK